MRRRKKKTHFSSIGYPLGISVHRGPKSSQQPEKVVRHSLPLTDEETEAKKQSNKATDQPTPTAQGISARIQVQICLPPPPLFSFHLITLTL